MELNLVLQLASLVAPARRELPTILRERWISALGVQAGERAVEQLVIPKLRSNCRARAP